MEALLESMDEGVLVLDGEEILLANAALLRMVGPTATLVGRRTGDILADHDGRPLDSRDVSGEARLRTEGGGLLPVSVTRLGERLVLVRDRSRERALEQEVWRASRGAGGEAPGPGRAEWQALLGIIEHEIRTPITVVLGYTRLLIDGRGGELTGSQRESLVTIRKAAARIDRLLDSLLVYEGDDPTAVRVERRPTSLHDVIRDAVDAIRPIAEERSIAVLLELEPSADPVDADPFRLEQVFTNLLENALKFAPEGSTVRVNATVGEGEKGEVVLLTVEDEGPGIEAAEAERIFLPFVQGRAARGGSVGGVGLGLAICQRIVEAHGGSIEALPSPGGGLFRVVVPLAD